MDARPARALGPMDRAFLVIVAAGLVLLGIFELSFAASTQASCEYDCAPAAVSTVLIGLGALVALAAEGSAVAVLIAAAHGATRPLRFARRLFLMSLGGALLWYLVALFLYNVTGTTW